MVRHVEINNGEGKILRGYLTTPDYPFSLTVVFYHGFTGNRTEHNHLFRDFSRRLALEGMASLRMDFSGNGESDGDFCDFNFDIMQKEAKLMLLEAKKTSPKVVALGFSMGGAVAAKLAADYSHYLDALVLWSPAGNINELVQKRFETTKKLPNGSADILGFEMSEALYQSSFKVNWYNGLKEFSKPVLIIHGEGDQAVPYEYGKKYQEQFSDVLFELIPKANHGYDNRHDQALLITKTIQFLKGVKI